MSYADAEADRRIANIVLIGAVTAIDAAAATARVRFGDLDSPPLPVAQLRAGALSFWWMPEVGEQVVVVCPSGDVARGVVLAGIYAGTAPSSDAATPRIELDGGTMAVGGTIVVEGDVVASGVSLVTHTHSGVTPGSGNTEEPN